MRGPGDSGRRHFLLGAAAAMAAGCGVVPREPDVAAIYSYVPAMDPARRRPIITIPGILGSRLRVGREGPFIWGGPGRLSADPANPEEARLLALPIGRGTEPLSELTDEVRADGVLRKANARLLGGTVEQQVYDGLVTALNAGGFEFSRSEEEERERSGNNPGSLEFPYDWRRDIVEAARELDDFIERKAEQVARVRRERYGRAPDPERIRFDFVAHSMGGLVLRYWLAYGTRDIGETGPLPEPDWSVARRRAACAIFIAPPNLGSVSAFRNLLEGRSFGLLQPEYPPALIGTHHSLYQLLPRSRHGRVRIGGLDGPATGDLYDPALWEAHGWGILNPSEAENLAVLMPDVSDPAERRGRVRAHLGRVLTRAERLHRALDRPGTPRAVDLWLVVGTGLDTPATAVFDPASGEVELAGLEEGDGVVLRASALSDDRQGGYPSEAPRRPIAYRSVLLLPGEHVSLTHNPVFTDNLLYWLLDSPRVRGPAPA